ncbi:hypothetical protein Tb11.02.0050 [Trypanosoma brucei brucei TREU927]|uniref:Uncharacterized protein n=1 Tax=Trypanosoma brucei brucei (strain 927/4 GUTat10.1) TaxID=185431 RepID=Q386R5_TRYB2|nr:hypothetical protein Tb11.02.0050 [Trypanosoma brucei brucei TREU927]EAN79216.1 hypothetical protein Tb11.02.0050 [Trypanosoma brucei brucei TREU927]
MRVADRMNGYTKHCFYFYFFPLFILSSSQFLSSVSLTLLMVFLLFPFLHFISLSHKLVHTLKKKREETVPQQVSLCCSTYRRKLFFLFFFFLFLLKSRHLYRGRGAAYLHCLHHQKGKGCKKIIYHLTYTKAAIVVFEKLFFQKKKSKKGNRLSGKHVEEQETKRRALG